LGLRLPSGFCEVTRVRILVLLDDKCQVAHDLLLMTGWPMTRRLEARDFIVSLSWIP
jgi:hypothetical protein